MSRFRQWLIISVSAVAAAAAVVPCMERPAWRLERSINTNSMSVDSAMTRDGRYTVILAKRTEDTRLAEAALVDTVSGAHICDLPQPDALLGRLLYCSADGQRLVAVEPLSHFVGGPRCQVVTRVASWSVARGEFLGDGFARLWAAPPAHDQDSYPSHFDVAPDATRIAISLGEYVHVLALNAADPDTQYMEQWGGGAHTIEYSGMELLATFVLGGGEGGSVQAEFSHDGTRILAWDRIRWLETWDLAASKSLGRYAAPKATTSDMWSASLTYPRGLFAHRMALFAWDWATGRPVWEARIPGHVRTLTWSADRTTILTTQFDNHARAWNAEDGESLFSVRGPWNFINNAALLWDGSYLAMSCWDATSPGNAMVDVFKRDPSGGVRGVIVSPAFWAVPLITAGLGLAAVTAVRRFKGKER